MHIRLAHPSLVLATLAVVAACAPTEENKRAAADSAATVQAKVMAQAGEVMSVRREAQVHFDSARAALAAGNTAIASAELRAAAAFTKQQADSATSVVAPALLASANELERLATLVDRGAVKAPTALDGAFARAQIAEAQHHCTRALAAWKANNAAGTGAELSILTDHFERAVSDAGKMLDSATKAGVADAKDVAASLMSGKPLPPDRVENALSVMDKAVHGLVLPRVTKEP